MITAINYNPIKPNNKASAIKKIPYTAVHFAGEKSGIAPTNDDYKKYLIEKYKKITQKADELKKFLPNTENLESLPQEIINPNQEIQLIKTNSQTLCKGKFHEILPFSPLKEYTKLATAVRNTWVPYLEKHNPNAKILPLIKDGKFDQGMTILTLEADGKIQGIGALKIEKNKIFIRELNVAPWNQGTNKKIAGVGKALMGRLVSICFETNNFPINLYSVDNLNSIEFYKHIGMSPTRIMHYFDKTFYGFKFDKESALKFLKSFNKR